jgi:hypothetical protein
MYGVGHKESLFHKQLPESKALQSHEMALKREVVGN